MAWISRRTLFTVMFFGCGLVTVVAHNGNAAERPEKGGERAESERHRSPVDLVLSEDEKWLVTANQTSDSASLVKVADGNVLDEVPVGRRPEALALCLDGQHVVISVGYEGVLVVLQVRGERLVRVREIRTGYHPHGLAVTADGRRAYVALGAASQVALVDLVDGQVLQRIEVGRWPRHLALSPDGSRLAVGTAGDRGVSVVDTAQGEMLFLERIKGVNIGHMTVSSDGQHAYFPFMTYRQNPITADNIRRGWVFASRIGRLKLDKKARREALSLDARGRAIADPHGLAISSDELTMVASAGGTHELLVYRMPGLPFKDYGNTDHIDSRLLADKNRFYRIDLGGRPLGLRMGRDDRTVYVANYLEDAIQVVDLEQRQEVRRLRLGGPATASLARRGESIFYDGTRSLDQWYSCHSCHQEGGGNPERIDTFNDDTAMTFKTVLPLYRVVRTAPWTWHGWQKDLRAAMQKSITSTMLGEAPSDEDVDAMIAYLATLEPPPNPHRQSDGSLSAAAQRGKQVFHSARANCASCHSGPNFTDGKIHDLGLGGRQDRYVGFNTPSLVGVHSRIRLMHDGRASSLEELLTGPHNPAEVTGEGDLTDEERRDLIAYLKSL